MEAIDITEFPHLCAKLEEDGYACFGSGADLYGTFRITWDQLAELWLNGFVTVEPSPGNGFFINPVLAN